MLSLCRNFGARCTLIVIPTLRHLSSSLAQILLQPLPLNNYRLAILQHEQHPCPFSQTWVFPRVHCPTLHCNVASLQDGDAPVVKFHFDTTFEHDTIVEGLRPMHERGMTWAEIYNAANCAAWVNETEGSRLDCFLVGFNVTVVVEGHREGRCRINDIETDRIVTEKGPVVWTGALDCRLAGGIMGRHMDIRIGKLGREGAAAI